MTTDDTGNSLGRGMMSNMATFEHLVQNFTPPRQSNFPHQRATGHPWGTREFIVEGIERDHVRPRASIADKTARQPAFGINPSDKGIEITGVVTIGHGSHEKARQLGRALAIYP